MGSALASASVRGFVVSGYVFIKAFFFCFLDRLDPGCCCALAGVFFPQVSDDVGSELVEG